MTENEEGEENYITEQGVEKPTISKKKKFQLSKILPKECKQTKYRTVDIFHDKNLKIYM